MRKMVLLAVIGLSGCLTTQEQAQRIAQADDDKCGLYGLKYGTPQFAECRLKLEQMRSNERAAQMAAPASNVNCTRIGYSTNCVSY